MQPSPDAYTNVSRRPLEVDDYIDILRRHMAWILGPAFGALVIAVVVAFLWPNTYVSRAVIRVVPPQVPENFVPTNITQEMSQRINAMYQTISSRGTLTNMINMFNLYPRERQRKPIEDIIEQMRTDIRISNVIPLTASPQGQRGVSAFSIEFAYEDRIAAQKVTADLVSRFMSENARERERQSVMTTQFLRDQADQAKKELDLIEDRLMKFRTSAQGRLPDQVQQNQIQLTTTENRISNIHAAISRVSQEKMLIESDLRTMKNQLASLAPISQQMAQQQQQNEQLVQIDREILHLEGKLAVLKESYTDSYPDVRRLQGELTTARRIRDKIAAEEESKKASAPAQPVQKRVDPNFDRESRNLQVAIERYEAQLKGKDVQIEEYNKELASAERQIKLGQGRIEQMPASEQQYLQLIRDQGQAKQHYEELNKKRAQSALAEDLERRHQGEALEVLDPASLPITPTKPDRPVIIGAGAALGLMLGLVLAGVREAKDTSLKNLKDVRAYTQLTVLGSIPLLENDLVVRRRKRLAWLAWSTACLVGVLVMTGAVFYHYSSK